MQTSHYFNSRRENFRFEAYFPQHKPEVHYIFILAFRSIIPELTHNRQQFFSRTRLGEIKALRHLIKIHVERAFFRRLQYDVGGYDEERDFKEFFSKITNVIVSCGVFETMPVNSKKKTHLICTLCKTPLTIVHHAAYVQRPKEF